LKVAVDTLFLAERYQHSGTAAYLKRLLRECLRICETQPGTSEFHGFLGPEDYWNRNGLESPYMRVHKTRALGSRRLWLIGGMALKTMMVRPDIVFLPTAQHSLPAPTMPVVATILDAIPSRLPTLAGQGWRRMHAITWFVARLAAKVITISECSKRDLIEVYGVNPGKVVVTYLGYDRRYYNNLPPDASASEALLTRLGIRRPFLVHHGTVQLRKNVHRLIQAWDLLRARCRQCDVQLVLAGPMGFGSEEILKLREASQFRNDIVVTGQLGDAELALLVKNATLAVIPSLYEGFCLPMIEAMACGLPTIASNSSCLPEISGGVLEYFDPLSVEEMAHVIQRVLAEPDLQSKLRSRGLVRASEFSWERCARQTFDVFQEVLRLSSGKVASSAQ
jgi:glycosyltransferase involved in cell wall biosynthesis